MYNVDILDRFGLGQNHFFSWRTIDDIILFEDTLQHSDRNMFLFTFSAIAWLIWKHRNDICFQHNQCMTGKTMIISIICLICYWIGAGEGSITAAASKWLPEDVNTIPLQTWDPEEGGAIQVLDDDN